MKGGGGVASAFDTLVNRGARSYHDANQAIVTATATILNFNTNSFDDGGFYTAADRFTIPAGGAGWYLMIANIEWDEVTAGRRRVEIIDGAGLVLRGRVEITDLVAANTGTHICPVLWKAAAGEFFRVQVYHTRGSNLNVMATNSHFSIARVGLLPTT